MDPFFLDDLRLSGPLCRGCLAPVPIGRFVWCSTRCQNFVRAHPNDFLRIFRWCRSCGVEIDHMRPDARFCSKTCAKRSPVGTAAVERDCESCGAKFEANKGRGGQTKRWCGSTCYRWARRHPGERRPTTRTCLQCSADISHRAATAKYCSKRCTEVAYGHRLPAALPLATCTLPECGITFQPWRTGQRCCCEKHAKLLYNRESRADGRQKAGPWNDRRRDAYHRRRALKKAAATGDPVLFADIAERDRWRCHICGTRVGKKIAWPHPRSPSLDHLIPLTELGAHDPTNVRLAHLVCNTAKGNRGGGEQLLLIG